MGSITVPIAPQKFETCPVWGATLDFWTSRYLIDFTTGISDTSAGLASPDYDPAWTRTPNNEFADQHRPIESATSADGLSSGSSTKTRPIAGCDHWHAPISP
jgi:hypothetical protein